MDSTGKVLLVAINSTPALLDFMCPAPDQTCGTGYEVPPQALWALLYWIVFVSGAAFGLITWANQHLESSVVSSYFVLQPVVTAILSMIIVAWTPPPHYNLHGPSFEHFGELAEAD